MLRPTIRRRCFGSELTCDVASTIANPPGSSESMLGCPSVRSLHPRQCGNSVLDRDLRPPGSSLLAHPERLVGHHGHTGGLVGATAAGNPPAVADRVNGERHRQEDRDGAVRL